MWGQATPLGLCDGEDEPPPRRKIVAKLPGTKEEALALREKLLANTQRFKRTHELL